VENIFSHILPIFCSKTTYFGFFTYLPHISIIYGEKLVNFNSLGLFWNILVICNFKQSYPKIELGSRKKFNKCWVNSIKVVKLVLKTPIDFVVASNPPKIGNMLIIKLLNSFHVEKWQFGAIKRGLYANCSQILCFFYSYKFCNFHHIFRHFRPHKYDIFWVQKLT